MGADLNQADLSAVNAAGADFSQADLEAAILSGATIRAPSPAIVPISAVRALFVVSLCLILIWVIRLPRQSTEPESGAKRWDENLKPLAVVALLIQIVIYMVF